MEYKDLEQYLELDDDELLEELGSLLLGSGPNFGPSDFERQRRFARAWLERRKGELQVKLCGDVLKTIEKKDGFDALADAAIVADGLATMLGRPSASIVAVILVRRGLASLCKEGIPS